MEDSNKAPIIPVEMKRLTRKADLIWWNNQTLHQLMSHEINIKVLESRDPKEKFGDRQLRMGDGSISAIKVTCGQQLASEKQDFERQNGLLKMINELLAKEE